MSARSKKRHSDRLSHDRWLALALDVLARKGTAKLRIDRLARDLGLTKGSFYWHFKNRNDFVSSLARYWADWSTKQIADEVGPLGCDAREKLYALMEAVIKKDLGGYDLLMRAWAAREPSVARIVREVDKERLAFVRSLFFGMGFRGRELERRTRLFVCYFAGEHVFFAKESRKKQLKEAKEKLAIFTSQ